jgi:UDP:flavonoid glycosyltransferase YjiC (YdhE family)
VSVTAPTVCFFPEGAFGPTNNCVGIGQALQARGARVVFILEESFAGTLAAQGFEERLVRLAAPAAVESEPGQFWKDFIRDTAPQFRRPTLEQLEGLIVPIWVELLAGARYVEEQLAAAFREIAPDVIVEDNVLAFPAIAASGRPWVRIVSCNPLELADPELPPAFSGYPLAERSGWGAFGARYRELHGRLHAEHSEFCVARGAPPLPAGSFIHESSWLGLYVYPAELDYPRSRPLAPSWRRLESCVRSVAEPWQPPEGFAGAGGRLVYLSLGSLGSADVELMRRLIAALADSPHRVIVSKGPQHELIELAPNMIGAEFLPQPSILPEVDVVLTHGGNNTVTESLHFGKPMVVLPLFWDQHDNAQRVQEAGLGRRLDPFDFEPAELLGAVEALCADAALAARLGLISRRLRANPGTELAAELIIGVASRPAPSA